MRFVPEQDAYKAPTKFIIEKYEVKKVYISKKYSSLFWLKYLTLKTLLLLSWAVINQGNQKH